MRILFVCTANICRSVMAEAMMKALADDFRDSVEISSAGIDAVSDSVSDKFTQGVCSKHGLDIGSHRSRQLTKLMLDRSDLVLCLAENHRQSILSAYPQFESKVFLLKQFRKEPPAKKPSIEDPIGKPRRRYERCFRDIQQEVKRIAPLLFQKKT
jgi:protein-tyrosine phosphatase